MDRITFDLGQPAPISSRATEEGWTLIMIRDLQHPPGKVWAALTDPAQLERWAPFTADRDLGRLGQAVLTMVDGDAREDLPAVVTRADRPAVLEYTWDTDRLRWSLEATATGTRLTLEHTVTGRDSLAPAAAGWHLCLVVAERLLDGRPVDPIRGEDARNHGWDELHQVYAAKLGMAEG